MSNTCIRVLADPVQIRDCKETLDRLDDDLQEATQLFKLAGSATRMKILFLLHRESKMCPCDISDVLNISVGGISQHLRKLKDRGVVHDKKVGQTVFYSIRKDKNAVLKTLFELMIPQEKPIIS